MEKRGRHTTGRTPSQRFKIMWSAHLNFRSEADGATEAMRIARLCVQHEYRAFCTHQSKKNSLDSCHLIAERANETVKVLRYYSKRTNDRIDILLNEWMMIVSTD